MAVWTPSNSDLFVVNRVVRDRDIRAIPLHGAECSVAADVAGVHSHDGGRGKC